MAYYDVDLKYVVRSKEQDTVMVEANDEEEAIRMAIQRIRDTWEDDVTDIINFETQKCTKRGEDKYYYVEVNIYPNYYFDFYVNVPFCNMDTAQNRLNDTVKEKVQFYKKAHNIEEDAIYSYSLYEVSKEEYEYSHTVSF
jgi:hypothetical protein